MSLAALIPMQTAFESVEMQDDGLVLTACDCNGSSRIYVPRTHIDYLHSGRIFYFRTLVVGIALMAVGVVYLVNNNDDANQRTGEILMGVGGAIILLALFLMLPSSLIISTNNGIFVSTQTCGGRDRLNDISRFVATGVLPKEVNFGIGMQQGMQVQPYPAHIGSSPAYVSQAHQMV